MPSLLIDIEARYAQFRDAMDNVGKDGAKAVGKLKASFGELKDSIGALAGLAGLGGIISGAGLVQLTRQVADQADALNDLSQRTGVAVEELSKLQYAAKFGGTTSEDLNSALVTLSKNMAETAAGIGKARSAFNALGLTQDIQKGKFKDAGELFTVVAEKLSQYADGANKSALAQKIFGDVGEKLIPTLNEGADGLKRMGDEAERLGVVFSEKLAQQAADFNDNMDRLKQAAEGVKISIGSKLLPTLAELAQQMVDGIELAGGFGAALKAMGDINPFKSLAGNIGNINEEIASLQSSLARMDKKGTPFDILSPNIFNGRDEVEKRLEQLKAQREFLQRMQAREALSGLGDIRDPRDIRNARTGEPEKKPAPALKPPSTLGPLDDPRLKTIERSIQEEQQLLASRNQTIQLYNSQNLMSFQEYYAARTAAQKEATDKIRQGFDEELALLNQKKVGAKPDEQVKITEKINEVTNKRRELEQQVTQQSVTDWFDQQQAAKQYTDQLSEIDARLAEMRGETSKAIMIRFDIQAEPLKQRLLVEAGQGNPDTAGRDRAQAALDQLDSLRTLTKAQADSNALMQEAEVIQQKLDTAERRAELDMESGMSTELDMMNQLGIARKDAVRQLEDIAEQMKAIAILSDDPKMIANAEAFKLKLDQLRQSADVLGNKVNSVFRDNFANALADVATGTKTLKQAFKDMADSIVREINRIAAQEISKQIFSGSSSSGSGGGGGLSGLVGSFLGMFAKNSGTNFAPVAEAAFTPVPARVGRVFDNGLVPFAKGGVFDGKVAPFASGGAFGGNGRVLMSPTLFKFASGAGFSAGVAGEAGAEAVMPLRRGRDGKLGVVAAGGSMSNVFHITVAGAMSDDQARRTGMQVGASAARKLSQASRRNG